MGSIRNKINSLRRICYGCINLPVVRSNEGLDTDEKYIDSIREQILHLRSLGALKPDDRILDFGCGQGRLANGLKYFKIPAERYVGIDTDLNAINWCIRFIPGYYFIHLPAYNERYNQSAKDLRCIPLAGDQFDLIFLNSVFSHMIDRDIKFYLKEFNRLLKPNGIIYLTVFVEDDVPNMDVNPRNYISDSNSPLHRVRYERSYFIRMIESAGFSINNFYYQHITRVKQSVFICKTT